MQQKKILIASISHYDKVQKKFQRTAADQLKELFTSNHIPFILTTYKKTRLLSLLNAIRIILTNYRSIDIAIVPLFGTTYSFLWQTIIVWVLKIFKKKIVLILRGGSIPQRMKKVPGKFIRSFKNSDIVISPSGFMHSFLQRYNVSTILIENVVNLKHYNFYKKNKLRPRIIWMRAFEDTYNPEMAIRVANLLAEKYDDFQMVMAGSDRGLLAPVKKLANQYGILEKIIFPGYIGLQRKLEYAGNYDIYISTNRVDNAPVSFVEFMLMGVPVVSVNVGGVPYIIEDGYNGLLAELYDEASMAEKIELLIENADYASSIINNAYEYAQRYDEPVILQKWLHLFEKLSA